MKSVCLAILNYNGRKHLEHLLPTACAAAKNYLGKCSVLVLDNRSPDPDGEWVKREFPSVQVVIAPENDFLFSYNWLLPRLQDDIVVLLNNDLRVDEHFLEPLIRHFKSSDVFAVSASSYDWEGHERTIGPARLVFRNGFYNWSYDTQRQELCHTLFTSGGFMAVDRLKFLLLGGFNRLFYPAYCEDLDLCFRAWRQGWRSIYEPASVVWHRESGSWKSSTAGRLHELNLRTALLFQWSSLPMERDRIIRYWTVMKLFAGECMQGKNLWLSVYPRAVRDWRKMRRQYSELKTSSQELASIQKALNASLLAGNKECAFPTTTLLPRAVQPS
ncbi:MAG: glycosyltransferase family 2 protein [Limisphaerales bacterium]